MKNFAIRDWWKPLLAGVIASGLSWYMWKSQDCVHLNILADEVLKISFTYATTMFGLLMAAYTILQGFTSERVEMLRKWSFYQRYKMNLLRTLRLLVCLGIGSILCWVCYEKFHHDILLVLLSLVIGLIVFTLMSTYGWVHLLIKHFDASKE